MTKWSRSSCDYNMKHSGFENADTKRDVQGSREMLGRFLCRCTILDIAKNFRRIRRVRTERNRGILSNCNKRNEVNSIDKYD